MVNIMKAANVEKKLDSKGIKAILGDEKMSKSQKIRELFDGGLDVKEISEVMNVRYNFAYNVLSNYININGIDVEKTERASKRDEIVVLLNEGKSLAEVSRITKTNYNYIWKINKELKDEKEIAEAKAAEAKADKDGIVKVVKRAKAQ